MGTKKHIRAATAVWTVLFVGTNEPIRTASTVRTALYSVCRYSVFPSYLSLATFLCFACDTQAQALHF